MVSEFLRLIKGRKIVAFTGSGASAESGIPTFRGKGGLWEKYDPQTYATLPYAFHTFLKHPEKIANFLVEAYETFLKAEPNATHYALAKLEEEGAVLGVITQNIDNLHQLAGTSQICELHGNTYRFFCRRCGYAHTKTKEEIRKFIDTVDRQGRHRKNLIKKILSFTGRCRCGKLLITSVIFFGQGLPQAELNKASFFLEQAEVFLCIGASGVVMPAASFPFYAKQKGCTIIEVNPESSELSYLADLRIQQPSSAFFSQVLEYL
ncbi:MAG: Sir2 family NAD-dependent protein deacetylase [Candidatus Omnitrophica bacterium]|nr:Sir2 family NAD-dependent protein deacetylase [Candidatus Omnitrophota bacterium]